MMTVGILLVRAAKQRGAAYGRVAYKSAVAAETLEVFSYLQPLGRVIKTGHRQGLPAHFGQHAHYIPAGAANLLQDFLIHKRPHRRPLRVLPDDDNVQIEYSGSYDCLIHDYTFLFNSSQLWHSRQLPFSAGPDY